jgi:hypothetical protein
VYDMYPAWDEPASTAASKAPEAPEAAKGKEAKEAAAASNPANATGDASPPAGTASPPTGAVQARVPHIRTARRHTKRRHTANPGPTPALSAVQASLDRRDNGGAAASGTTLNGLASRAPAGTTRQ